MAVLVGGLGDHLPGDLGEFDEASTSLEDGSEDVLSLFNGVKGVLEILGSSVGKRLLKVSLG